MDPHRTLKVSFQNFKVIYTHFQNTAARGDGGSGAMQGQALKTIKEMSDFKQVLFMHFMLDTLDVISHLSLVIQKDAVTKIAEVKNSIERTCLSIQAMVVRPGAKFSQFLEAVTHGNQKMNTLHYCKQFLFRISWDNYVYFSKQGKHIFGRQQLYIVANYLKS